MKPPAEQARVGAAADVRSRGWVTWRAVALGTVGALFVCAVTPYNNYVAKNTDMVGGFLPLALVMFSFVVAVLVNAPLWKWMPRRAFAMRELALASAMVMVACSVPGRGLMGMLPANLAAFQARPASDPAAAEIMQNLALPRWLLPDPIDRPVDDVVARAVDPTFRDFLSRQPQTDDYTWQFVRRLGAWWRPALGWGALFAALLVMALGGIVILNRQWAENERLAFPLVSVYASLIDEPRPGRAFNELFSSRAFWLTCGAVFVAHGMGALSNYFPRQVPSLPLSYDLRGILSAPPLSELPDPVKSARVFFSVIGLCYFMRTQMSFTLWAAVLMLGGQAIATTAAGGEFPIRAGYYQSLGALVVILGMIVWTGRRQWFRVLRAMAGRSGSDDRASMSPDFLSDRAAGWMFAIGLAGVVTWLAIVGAGPVGTLLSIAIMLAVYLVAARIVAETGLFQVMISIDFGPPNQMILQAVHGSVTAGSAQRNYFWACFTNYWFVQSLRESTPPFLANGLRLVGNAEEQAHSSSSDVRERSRGAWGVIVVLGLTFVLAYFASGISTLWVEYRYDVSIDRSAESPINSWAAVAVPESLIRGLVGGYAATGPTPVERNLLLTYASIGASVALLFAVLRLRWAAWPLHPFGVLLATAPPVQAVWFSLFIGWLAKTLLLQYGGSAAFQRAKPVFLGFIVGEAGAAAFWLLVNLVLASMGQPFVAVRLLPG
jgi:hypothetical protein